jgi:hypothetical protein
MKLVSFDIGLRNLAVCVMDGANRKDCKILHWDVIDVIGEKNGVDKPTCFKCKKPAMWSQKTGSGSYACSKHCPKTAQITKAVLTKKSAVELAEMAKAHGLCSEDRKYKKPDFVNAIHAKLTGGGWTKFKGNAGKGAGDSVLSMDKDLAAVLDRRADWWKGADLVIFENQPNRRMFAVQAMLHMYFACKGFKTRGVSAIHKLDNIVTAGDDSSTYRGRKKTGIAHCELLCPPENLEFFRKHRKKDDLADAQLQGLYILEHIAAQ